MVASWLLLLEMVAFSAGALPNRNDQSISAEANNVKVMDSTVLPASLEESYSSAGGDFCPIIWDASLSDCVKLEKLMDFLGNNRYGGELCHQPEKILGKARQCCMQESREDCSRGEKLRYLIKRGMPKVPDVVDS